MQQQMVPQGESRGVTYFIVCEKSDRILDILFCPGREATVREIEDAARPLANEARSPVYVLEGRHTGLRFENGEEK